MLDQLSARLDEVRDIVDKDIVLVVGVAKSGTTWVQKMLNTHPEIYCAGEGKFAHLLQGFLKAVNSYNKALDYTNRTVYPEGAYYRTWDDATIAAAAQFMMSLCWARSSHKDLSRVRYIGDKDTEYHVNMSVWRDMFFKNARIVHVVRDGRDCAISLLHQRNRTNRARIDVGTEDFDKFLREYAHGWANDIRRVREAFRDLPHLYHEIRYEDLLKETERRLNAILTFLGVEQAPDLVQHIVTENTFRKLSGDRDAGTEDRGSFYRKGVAGEWEKILPPRARQIFTDSSGDMLKDLGYKTD